MIVLGIDTALRSGGVALLTGTRRLGRDLGEPGRHAERLLAAAEELLAEGGIAWAEVAGIAVNVGPGSFTGIRIGVAAALGMGEAAGLPVTGVGCLLASARACAEHAVPAPRGTVVAVADIRRGEVVWAPFRVAGAEVHPAGEERRVPLDAPGPSPAGPLWIAGEAGGILWPEREDAVQWTATGAARAVATALLGREALLAGEGEPPDPRYARPADARPKRG